MLVQASPHLSLAAGAAQSIRDALRAVRAAGGNQLLKLPAPSALHPGTLLSSAGIVHHPAGNFAAGCEHRRPAASQADAASEQPGASNP